jgi:hypothetical protein
MHPHIGYVAAYEGAQVSEAVFERPVVPFLEKDIAVFIVHVSIHVEQTLKTFTAQ